LALPTIEAHQSWLPAASRSRRRQERLCAVATAHHDGLTTPTYTHVHALLFGVEPIVVSENLGHAHGDAKPRSLGQQNVVLLDTHSRKPPSSDDTGGQRSFAQVHWAMKPTKRLESLKVHDSLARSASLTCGRRAL
jgi:hypothetical protein